MSFKCGFCGEVQRPGTKETKIITEIREKGDGSTEIVKEKNACVSCTITHNVQPKMVGSNRKPIIIEKTDFYKKFHKPTERR